jgi:hypothetical protein
MSNNDSYNRLKINTLFKLESKIESYFPNVTDSDYSKGWISRYFVQKTNDKRSSIYEVNYSEFIRIKYNTLFTSVIIKWRISGPKTTQYDSNGNVLDKGVSESNRISISLVNDKIPNLKFYLPNLLQFHK